MKLTVKRTKRDRLKQLSLCDLLVLFLCRADNNKLAMQRACGVVSNYMWDTDQSSEIDSDWNYSHNTDNLESDIREACRKAKGKGWIKKAGKRGVWELTASGIVRAGVLEKEHLGWLASETTS
jgi:hypothetical protein